MLEEIIMNGQSPGTTGALVRVAKQSPPVLKIPRESIEVRGVFGSGFKYCGKHPFKTTFCVLGIGVVLFGGVKCGQDLFSRWNNKRRQKNDIKFLDAKCDIEIKKHTAYTQDDILKNNSAREAEAKKHQVCAEADSAKFKSDCSAKAELYDKRCVSDVDMHKAKEKFNLEIYKEKKLSTCAVEILSSELKSWWHPHYEVTPFPIHS